MTKSTKNNKTTLVLLLTLIGVTYANQISAHPEDEAQWGRTLLDKMSMSNDDDDNEWAPSDWPTPSPTPWPTWSSPPPTPWPTWSPPPPTPFPTPLPTPEPVCGNGVIEAGEECEPPGGEIGGSPYECGPYEFCNDSCQCEFPEGACLSRIGVVPHGHLCLGSPSDKTHTCCNGGEDQGPDNLCNECQVCEHNVAIDSKCCVINGATECATDDVCCPMTAFGRNVMVCLPPDLGSHGESCEPELCTSGDIESENELCLNCLDCLIDSCPEFNECLQTNDYEGCAPTWMGGRALNGCEQCQTACFQGSKNGAIDVGVSGEENRALRGTRSKAVFKF